MPGTRFWVHVRQGLVAAIFLVTQARAGASHAESAALIGASEAVILLEPFGAGRLLMCTARRCDTWSLRDRAWKPTGAMNAQLSLVDVVHTRMADGQVVAIDRARQNRAQAWSPATGRWQLIGGPPSELRDLRLGTLRDGRLIVTGRTAEMRQAFTAGATGWFPLTERPAGSNSAALVPLGSGVVWLSSKERWHYGLADGRWTSLDFTGVSPEAPWDIVNWGGDGFFYAWRDGRLEGLRLDGEGKAHGVLAVPINQTYPQVQSIVTADTSGPWLLLPADQQPRLWKPADQTPAALPAFPAAPLVVVGIDANHLVGWSPTGSAVILYELGTASPAPPPCAGLQAYLTDGTERASSPWYYGGQDGAPEGFVFQTAFVSEACREDARRGGAASLIAQVRAWTRRPERAMSELGRTLSCALQDDAALAQLPEWFSDDATLVTRTTCFTRLRDWPGGEDARRRVLKHALVKGRGGWRVDAAVRAYLKDHAKDVDSGLRDELVPLLQAAHKHHADGFGDLRAAVCAEERTASSTRTRVCSDLGAASQEAWHREDNQPMGRRGRVIGTVAATAVVAGAIAGTYVMRNSDGGRVMTTASCALGGAPIGLGIGALILLGSGSGYSRGGGSDGAGAALVGGAVLGAVAGGIAGYALASSPSARAPVTGAGLALPYIITLAWLFE